ncbi:MAG: 30S ribosomal protein S8 [candidate division Zixibacteria bacterium]|jgi:small subunit ribosomal protein S8|nr:30S ribosomal protein S8 [candidate division Zixibacteria bacterium]
MSMTDPIADMLTRIRNGAKAKRKAVDVPASNVKREIAKVLIREKFIKDMVELPDNRQGILRLYLKYSREDKPIIKGLKRLSTPGLRRYYGLDELKKIGNNQVGLVIISTSQGIMTNLEAYKNGLGGEAVCSVW